MKRTEVVTECAEWEGSRTKAGYGHRWWKGKLQYTHRIAWEEANGEIPKGMEVCHRCDNPACYLVEHLFLGTHQDNLADMVKKGRMSRGERRRNHKLTEEQAKEAMTRMKGGESQASIGRCLGVSRGAIQDIRRGRSWGWLFTDEELPFGPASRGER